MKEFIPNLLKMAIISVTLTSCSDEIFLPNQTPINSLRELTDTRSEESDEILRLHKRQSDQMSMIINCILEKDSVFSLDLSIEESRMLGIPDSVYQQGTEIIKSLNTLKSN